MNKSNYNVLFAVFEAAPFVKTGGLGDVGGVLPNALQENGCKASVIMPKFSAISEEFRNQMQTVATFTVPLVWRELYCGIEKLEYNGMTYYFVDNEYYFYRDDIYGFDDDVERVAFFCKAVLESIKYLPELACDIIHSNDWHTSLIPVYLRELYNCDERFTNIKTVFSVHNLKFQGIFAKDTLWDVVGLAHIDAAREQLMYGNYAINLMQGALHYSDMLSTVSPTYAEEIKTNYFGENMQDIFNYRNDVLYGILNGIDIDMFNPETDNKIPYNFTTRAISGKRKDKTAIQERVGLTVDKNVPLIVMISRLTEQKGLDIFLHILDELLSNDVQVVVLGTGDKCYETALRDFEERYKGKMCSYLAFDLPLSHLLYAGADILVMPSRFEPCGLSQMIAMRYGTLPVVRETGGLKDSVIPYNKETGEGTGFTFVNFNAHELLFALKDAIEVYTQAPNEWRKMMTRAMKTDVSWSSHAKEYVQMYDKLFVK